jgi:hypothetical protein
MKIFLSIPEIVKMKVKLVNYFLVCITFLPQSSHHYSESFKRVKMVFEKFLLAKLQLRKLFRIFGIDVFDENYKPGILTALIITLAFLANFSDAYTIVISYPDFMTILKTTTLWGICIQVMSYVFLGIW